MKSSHSLVSARGSDTRGFLPTSLKILCTLSAFSFGIIPDTAAATTDNARVDPSSAVPHERRQFAVPPRTLILIQYALVSQGDVFGRYGMKFAPGAGEARENAEGGQNNDAPRNLTDDFARILSQDLPRPRLQEASSSPDDGR